MITIHKYPFAIQDEFQLVIPAASQILFVELQRGVPCIWALVNDGFPKETKTLFIYGTGHPIERPLNTIEHVASFQQDDFVWHLFQYNESSSED